jgi:SAM-dependent methyltransferase
VTTVTLAAAGALEGEWNATDACPACGGRGRKALGRIPDRCYAFGAEQVRLPEGGVALLGCEACALIYKSVLPAPAFLAALFEREMGAKWMETSDLRAEAAEIARLAGRDDFDLLDVGAAGGDLLRACAARGARGRRSALDVARYPGIEDALAGELILGFLDSPSLAWRREPYDVVTAFDVFEHLYDPRTAFANLSALVRPGGWLVIESGNPESFWPRAFGTGHWWYARLIEHHIFWTRRALAAAAAAAGFELVAWQARRHKSRRGLGAAAITRDLAKTALYCALPRRFAALAQRFGRLGNQPWFPFTRDHFRAHLRRAAPG